jgi:hypothetical protein
MNSSRAMTVVRQVYGHVECALWAALLAFVIWFLAFVLPNLPATTRRAEHVRASIVAAENRAYCEKWGMPPGTHAHMLCTTDLQELRRTIERDRADVAGLF